MTTIAGLDVGGAHLKVAIVTDGRLSRAQQFSCPLWKGTDKLDAALAQASALTRGVDQFAVTMTGELSDLFADRREGVGVLVERLEREFGTRRCHFWQGRRGFGAGNDAKAHSEDVGSMNFLATAQFAAPHVGNGFLLDMGSTTTDVVSIVEGAAVPRGLTDGDRLATGELIYTGLTRTAVMAVATHAPFKGRRHGLMREYLATMADVYRILGELPDGVDQHETADGRGKSREESLARFVRMFGCDLSDVSEAELVAAARFIAGRQMSDICDGIAMVGSQPPIIAPSDAAILCTGIGFEAVRTAAGRYASKLMSLDAIVGESDVSRLDINANAPAIAVAMLLGASSV